MTAGDPRDEVFEYAYLDICRARKGHGFTRSQGSLLQFYVFTGNQGPATIAINVPTLKALNHFGSLGWQVVSEVDHVDEPHPNDQELLRQLQTQLSDVTELVGRYDRFVLMRRIAG